MSQSLQWCGDSPHLQQAPLHPHYDCEEHSEPPPPLCGCSRSDADASTGPWTRCSPHTLGLHLSLIPSIAHPSLPGIFVQGKTLCQGVGGQAMNPRIFASPAQLQAGSQSGHASSCHCQHTGFAVSPCQITDPVIGAAFVEQGWDYTLRISISHSGLTLVSNHPAGNVVYLAGQCKHTRRATGADLSA